MVTGSVVLAMRAAAWATWTRRYAADISAASRNLAAHAGSNVIVPCASAVPPKKARSASAVGTVPVPSGPMTSS